MTHVVVVSRLFSGLIETLENRHWRPAGVPAVAQLLVGLAAREDVSLTTVFTVKDRETAAHFPRFEVFDLSPVGRVYILPYCRTPGGWRSLELIATEISQLVRCLFLWIRLRPFASYFTYANLPIASFFAILGWSRVSLRFMGIMPYHRRLADGRTLRWIDRINRRFLRVRFTNVVCTEDGSDPRLLLPHLLHPAVPLTIKLNGVDRPQVRPCEIARLRKTLSPDGRPIVLYLGRMEPYKGCDEFVEAAKSILRNHPGIARFVLVGGGSRLESIKEAIAADGYEDDIRAVGSVPSSDVPQYLQNTLIYVSLNMHGNLSNANLEAVISGTCLVLPKEDQERLIDTSTTRLLPPETMPRFDRENIVPSLSKVILDLLEDREWVDRCRTASHAIAQRELRPWLARVDDEIALILGH